MKSSEARRLNLKRFAAIAAAATAALSAQAGSRLAPERLPASEWADTEVSTNMVFCAGAPADNRFDISMILGDAAGDNNVEIAFGMDADGNGDLSVEETEISVGWDCGEWRLRDFRGGSVLCGGNAADGLLLSIFLSGGDRQARAMGGNVFSGAAPATLFNPEWNLARVTARGGTPAMEQIKLSVGPAGFFMRFR